MRLVITPNLLCPLRAGIFLPIHLEPFKADASNNSHEKV